MIFWFAKILFSFSEGTDCPRNMQKDRFIGTYTLLYALFLVISAYLAFWNKWTLEEVALRYNKIFLSFEVRYFLFLL